MSTSATRGCACMSARLSAWRKCAMTGACGQTDSCWVSLTSAASVTVGHAGVPFQKSRWAWSGPRQARGARFDSLCRMLLAILATPPLRTSGHRTQRRVDMAAKLLGFDTTKIVNLLDVPTNDVTEISHVGSDQSAWVASREALSDGIVRADAALLAWGASEPTGPARAHFREQVAWVEGIIRQRGIDGWTVGGTARHPSRWQRLTATQSALTPFEEALRAALTRSIVGTSGRG